jgi:hypothetical protein
VCMIVRSNIVRLCAKDTVYSCLCLLCDVIICAYINVHALGDLQTLRTFKIKRLHRSTCIQNLCVLYICVRKSIGVDTVVL